MRISGSNSFSAGVSLFAVLLVGPTIDPADTVLAGTDLKAAAMERSGRHAVTAAEERDRILSLVAYVVAFRGWQDSFGGEARGHNIAAVLVDENGIPVSWGRNAVNITNNSTEHAEMRAMTCYLQKSRRNTLEGYTLYTTLEPGAMCAGTMILTELSRVVYGQKDPGFGGIPERLAIDSSSLPGGQPPYPRRLTSDGSTLYHRYWLDLLYEKCRQRYRYPRITKFLLFPETKQVFQDAEQALASYDVVFPKNLKILENALKFCQEIPAQYVEGCP